MLTCSRSQAGATVRWQGAVTFAVAVALVLKRKVAQSNGLIIAELREVPLSRVIEFSH